MSTPKPTLSELQRILLEHRSENRPLAPSTNSRMNSKSGNNKRGFSVISDEDSENEENNSQHATIPTDNDSDSENENENENIEIQQTCDQIRRQIRTFLEAGEMKVTHFQRTLNISASSYGNFMKLNGKFAGARNQTYKAAYLFFKSREENGIPMPKKKAATSTSNNKAKIGEGSTGISSSSSGSAEKTQKSKKAIPGEEVSDITLSGETTQTVPIYTTCDEMRRTINAHLRQPSIIQASFLRSLTSQHPTAKSITAKQLNDFRGKKGPKAGNSSAVFYAAYVYFEKLRIKEGKGKSKLRVEMEDVWGDEGGITLRDMRRGYWCGPGAKPVEDKYGRVSFVGGGRG
ncbi:MAG: hypothetical protein M1812_007714 [Candelaria pacifica]|nr:MAG: hypothetical protein M1812_007714 [Candelaria pacifica]